MAILPRSLCKNMKPGFVWLFRCLLLFRLTSRYFVSSLQFRTCFRADHISCCDGVGTLIVRSGELCLLYHSTQGNMKCAKRQAATMSFEVPARRFLAGRQLIFEGVATGTTKCMTAGFLRPYEVVDDESLDELENGASLRRSVLVTLKRGSGVEEAEEAISRLPGTVLNGNVVTLRLFGKPASQATQATSSQISGTFVSTPPSTPHLDTRRTTRAEARRRSMVPFTPEATLLLHSNATEDEPMMKLEREDAVIVTHQYDDVDIKQEAVENNGPNLPVITEDPSEEDTTRATQATDPPIDDQRVNRTVQRGGNSPERASSSTIAATPQTERSRKRRAPASFWAQDRTDSEGFIREVLKQIQSKSSRLPHREKMA
jgi:hypothetical protein